MVGTVRFGYIKISILELVFSTWYEVETWLFSCGCDWKSRNLQMWRYFISQTQMSLNTSTKVLGIKVKIFIRAKFTYKTDEGVIYYNKRQAIGFILLSLAKRTKFCTQFVFKSTKTKTYVAMVAHNLKVLYTRD